MAVEKRMAGIINLYCASLKYEIMSSREMAHSQRGDHKSGIDAGRTTNPDPVGEISQEGATTGPTRQADFAYGARGYPLQREPHERVGYPPGLQMAQTLSGPTPPGIGGPAPLQPPPWPEAIKNPNRKPGPKTDKKPNPPRLAF